MRDQPSVGAPGRDGYPSENRRGRVRSYTEPGFRMTIEQHQAKAEQLLRDAGILPVVTVDSVEQARRLADALLDGGLRSIELTLRTPRSEERRVGKECDSTGRYRWSPFL